MGECPPFFRRGQFIMKLNSLKTKFLAAFLPIFLGSFLVFFGISYYMSSQELIKDADTISSKVGQAAANDIEKQFQRHTMQVEGLARDSALIGGSKEQIVAELAHYKKTAGDGFAMLAYSTVDGQAVSDKGVDMDRSSRDYIKKVRETKQPYMTGPSVSGTSGKLITIIACPVLDKSDNLVGIVYGTVELEDINDIVGKIQYMETGRVYIADQDGLTIAYAQQPEDVGKMDLTQTEANGKTIDQKLVDAFKQAASTHQQISTEYTTSKGDASQAVLTPIDLGARTWVAVAVAPMSEVRGNAYTLAKILAGVGILMLIFVTVAIYVLSTKMSRPIEVVKEECDIINSGDLRERPLCYEADDELGALAKGFAQMRETMRSLLAEISKHAERVSASSEELTAAAHQTADAATMSANQVADIAEGINHQSESIATANAAVQDISGQSEQVSTNADAIAAVTEMTVSEVGRGKDAVQDIVNAMDAINTGTDTVQNSIKKLAKQSEEISQIVDVISGIAEQTNLLALNAAIEAARAGEAGRGFAVVADEVRKLAEESGTSSQKIAELVGKIQEDMKEAVEASDQSSQSVEGSRQSVEEANKIFESIQVSIEALAGGIRDVSTSIQTISDGTKSMAAETESIAKISHENASRTQSVSATTEEQSASSQEIAASTRVLAELAQELQANVQKFQL